MKGLDGLSAQELGNTIQQSAKAVTSDVKQQVTGNDGKNVSTNGGQGMQKPLEGLSDLLEKNQTQQSNTNNQHVQQAGNTANKQSNTAIAEQQKKDQAALAGARKNLQDLEEAMRKIREEREQKSRHEEQESEQKKMEGLEIEQKKQADIPLAFKRPSTGEISKATG